MIALGMREHLQVCGNKERSIVPPSYNRPGENTAGGNCKNHCLSNDIKIFLIFREIKGGLKKKGTKANNAKHQNPRTEINGKKLIEVQPSPSPEN